MLGDILKAGIFSGISKNRKLGKTLVARVLKKGGSHPPLPTIEKNHTLCGSFFFYDIMYLYNLGVNSNMKKENIKWILLITFSVLILAFLYVTFKDKIVEKINYVSEINRILSDDLEIERKWVIDKDNIGYDLSGAEVLKIEQTYICFSPEIRVRKINDGQQYSFAVKTNMTSDGMTRDEMEKNITKEEYENLVAKKEGNTVYKTRYQLLDGDYLIAIDIFEEQLEGLAYMEIEFENQEEALNFKTPEWVIKEVTGDVNYKNGYLARYGIPNNNLEF